MKTQVIMGFLLLSAAFLFSACSGSGSGGGGKRSGDNPTNVIYEDQLRKEDIVAQVGGICGKNRYYRILETEVIKRGDGLHSVGQLILKENGSYTLAVENFRITQRGPELFNYLKSEDRVVNGKWTLNGGVLNIEQGTIRKVSDISSDGQDKIYEFRDATAPDARKILFRPIEKVSERYIPADIGCPAQDSLIAQGTSGKFAIQTSDILGETHFFRRTTNRWDLEFLMAGRLSTAEPENYFCKMAGDNSENCSVSLDFTNSQSGSINVFQFDNPWNKFGIQMRMDDNLFQIEVQNGRQAHLAPAANFAGFYIVETEEVIGEQ